MPGTRARCRRLLVPVRRRLVDCRIMQTWESSRISTDRLETSIWTAGPEDGVPLLLVHGNLVTGGWWRYVAASLPDDVRVIAPDLRGFGRSEAKPIDATRGLGDMVDVVRSLLVAIVWGTAARSMRRGGRWAVQCYGSTR